MYPTTMQTINAERDREMREQASAWRRAQQARGARRARLTKISFALLARKAWSWPGGRGCTVRQQPENV